MRLRKAIWALLVWAALCLIALFPARWAGGLSPSSVKAYIATPSLNGTIWRGQAKVLPPQSTWHVNVNYRVNPFRAILGQNFAATNFRADGLTGKGQFGVWRAKAVTAEFDLARLPIREPRFAALSGQVFLTLDDFAMKDGCQRAAGNLRTNVLTANAARWKWTGPVLSGPISCEGEAVLLSLKGRDANYDVNLDVRIYKEGRYGVDVQIKPITVFPDEVEFALSLLGFETQADGRSAGLKEQGYLFLKPENKNDEP